MTDPKTVRDFPETLGDEAESNLVGVTTRGTPVYYDTAESRLVPMNIDGDDLVPDVDASWDVAPGETVEDVVDEIEETVGWWSLVDDEDEN
jgi:hypothetical protein